MKQLKNKSEFLLSTLAPNVENPESINAFTIYSQTKFNQYLAKVGIEELGSVSEEEIRVIEGIKMEVDKLRKKYRDIGPDRLEFDLAIIFHSNLKRLKLGRSCLNEYGMWRWLSMSHFLKEVFWRRGEEKMKKRRYLDAAKATYDHCVGKRIRDIFPRRYFLVGERLFDPEKKYDLLKRLSDLSKSAKTGGFGNLILNLLDTKLLSPNDHVAKIMSEILFTNGVLADDKAVAKAFARYNGFKRRMLNVAGAEIFQKEICIG